MTTAFPPWSYRSSAGVRSGADLVGFDVEATDGRIGSIDEASDEVDAAYIVVDTGPWIFGKKVLLPAGTISHIDEANQKVYVDRTKDQIRNSPGFDPDTYTDTQYRQGVADYYDRSYRNAPLR